MSTIRHAASWCLNVADMNWFQRLTLRQRGEDWGATMRKECGTEGPGLEKIREQTRRMGEGVRR